MPRKACRIELEVVSVRAERLLDITETDAVAEGIERHLDGWMSYTTFTYEADGETPANYFKDPRWSYHTL